MTDCQNSSSGSVDTASRPASRPHAPGATPPPASAGTTAARANNPSERGCRPLIAAVEGFPAIEHPHRIARQPARLLSPIMSGSASVARRLGIATRQCGGPDCGDGPIAVIMCGLPMEGSAMPQSPQLRPLGEALGTEAVGVDLSRLDDRTF